MKNSEKANKRFDYFKFTYKSLLGVAVICVLTLGSVLPAAAAKAPTAVTASGKVVGTISKFMVNEFLGIPYAAPPVGALRWTPPQPYGTFPGGTLQATQFGNVCTQDEGGVPGAPVVGSEDCLFLNVYSLKGTVSSSNRPVMVWIHGGALVFGSSNGYDPTLLVKQGVIVVTLNYRLGYLGFLAQSALDAEGHEDGNYGFMDQQFALQWVQNNIAAFGGDPTKVTIFGESAGGQSVYAHLASPTAAGLFSGAISESGSYFQFQDYWYDFIVPLAWGESAGSALVPSGDAVANAVGCTTPTTSACLRGVSAPALAAQQGTIVFPFVDGTLLTQPIGSAFASGAFNQVPVISGTNHDEWRLFVASEFDLVGNPILNTAEYDGATTATFGPSLAPEVLAFYPYVIYPSGGVALGAAGTDGIFACPARNANQALSQYVTTYAYEFDDPNAPPAQAVFGGALTFPLGAYHSAELQYLFKGANFFGLPAALVKLKFPQAQLSKAMVSYWTQFAKTGNPNSASQPVWSPYNAAVDEIQYLVPPTPNVTFGFADAHRCKVFWNQF